MLFHKKNIYQSISFIEPLESFFSMISAPKKYIISLRNNSNRNYYYSRNWNFNKINENDLKILNTPKIANKKIKELEF
jgi:hypothetical protein